MRRVAMETAFWFRSVMLVLVVVLFGMNAYARLSAQEKPKPATVGTGTQQTAVNPPIEAPKPAAEQVKVEQVPDDVQQQFATLEFKAAVKAEDVATLQKEVDSLQAEMGRLIQKLARPGQDLTRDPQTRRLIYVQKPPEAKK